MCELCHIHVPYDVWLLLFLLLGIMLLSSTLIVIIFCINAFKFGLPLHVFIISTEVTATQVCKRIVQECSNFKAVGFDAEWVTIGKTRQPIALLQLCSPKGTCALLRLNLLNSVPRCIKNILEDSSIIKVGVSPEGDSIYLMKDYRTVIRNTLDLRYLYPNNGSLAKLSKNILGITLNKNLRIRCSDWEALKLTNEQIKYAALDAYVAVEIIKKWSGMFRWFWRKNATWDEVEGKLIPFCDQKFRYVHYQYSSTNNLRKAGRSWEEKVERSKRFASQKKSLYDSCFMRAPDDTLLCTVKKTKAQWYLLHGRAELLSEDPYVIRLLFEPKIKPGENERLFEKELKCDQCVVCGVTRDLLRHCIVPRMYTRCFPLEMKSHHCHDILLFCIKCHLMADNLKLSQMLRLERLAGIDSHVPKKAVERNERVAVRFARALLKKSDTIPESRRLEMEKEIKNYFEIESLSENVLRDLASRNITTTETYDVNRGEAVVAFFQKDGRCIFDLRKIWREYFIDNMCPKFLPKHWSVDHCD